MKTSDIKGIIPPVITPMNNDPEQTVNHQALREQVERLLAGGVHGIFPMGTNGEAYALSFQEKEEILATVIDQVKGRVPVYAGTGCITTAETIRLSKRAEELGADALSVITPSFALASQKELYDHYTAVAKAVNLPIILYNIPARTGNKLLPETVQALCRDVENIVGAKDSSGDIENLKAYIRLTRELDKEVAILAGNDGAILTWAHRLHRTPLPSCSRPSSTATPTPSSRPPLPCRVTPLASAAHPSTMCRKRAWRPSRRFWPRMRPRVCTETR